MFFPVEILSVTANQIGQVSPIFKVSKRSESLLIVPNRPVLCLREVKSLNGLRFRYGLSEHNKGAINDTRLDYQLLVILLPCPDSDNLPISSGNRHAPVCLSNDVTAHFPI